VKKGSVSSLVAMVAAAPRADAIAPNLRIKSSMATPFFHPPSGLGGAPGTFLIPFAILLILLDSAGTSMVVDIFGF